MKKFKLYRNVVALALVGTMATTMLTGCSNKKTAVLEGTHLESTKVITFSDNSKDIAVGIGVCGKTACSKSHMNYRSIITNETFTECPVSPVPRDIIYTETIMSYLTEEEIAKSLKGQLTEDDVANIISRIVIEEPQKTK